MVLNFFSYKNGEIIAVSNAVKIHLNSYFKIPLQNIRVEYPIFTKILFIVKMKLI